MAEQRDEAFKAVFLTEYAPVMRMMRLILGSTSAAEDVTQEAFLMLFVHWQKVSRYEKPGAWVRRVAIRKAMRGRRRAKREAALGTEAIAEPAFPDLDVRRAVSQLSMAQRAAVVLHYYEGHPIADVASIMRVREGTVKQHLHRARARVAVLLGEETSDVAR